MEINDKQRALVRDVVDVLDKLKEMDVDMIDFILAQIGLAKPFFPGDVLKAVQSLETDLTLVRIFSEQARKYDQGSAVFGAFKALFGKEEEAHRIKAEDTPS